MTYHNKMMSVLFPKTSTVVVAEVAADEASKIRGLHGRTGLGPNGGMLFHFAPQAAPIAMTMANMLISLDFLFIGADGKVEHVMHRVRAGRPTPVLGPAVPWVLELPSGFARRHRIARGDTVVFASGAV